jgi:hypothetical protein
MVIAPEEKTSVKQPEQKSPPPTSVKKDSVAAPVALNDSLIFIISAKDSVWVSVSPDVGKGFSGKLAKGEVRRFSAKEKYIVSLGNRKAVSMTLGGKQLSNLPTVHGSNIVVRNVLLTRDKMSIVSAEKSNGEQEAAKNPVKPPSAERNKIPGNTPPIRKRIPLVKPVLPH